jgi:hypothetical protein
VAPNTVYVGADGHFEADPDTAVMQFNISAQEGTARAAYDRPLGRPSRYAKFCAPTVLIPKLRKSAITPLRRSRYTTKAAPSLWGIGSLPM